MHTKVNKDNLVAFLGAIDASHPRLMLKEICCHKHDLTLIDMIAIYLATAEIITNESRVNGDTDPSYLELNLYETTYRLSFFTQANSWVLTN